MSLGSPAKPMRTRAATALAVLLASLAPGASALAQPPAGPAVVLVVGAPGAPEYGERFRTTASTWQRAAERAKAQVTTIGLDPPANGQPSDRQRVERALTTAAAGTADAGPLWLVLIGHGTFDGRAARFNLRGPDITDKDVAGWLRPLRRQLVFINGASSSAPYLRALAGPGRIVVTATKTGNETSAPRFGPWMAEAISDLRADLDRDGGVSLLEAFLHAAKRVEASFTEEGLLASEHALLEDDGDGVGTGAAHYRGLAPAEGKGHAADGARARLVTLIPAPQERALPEPLRRRRDELETQVLALREKRATLAESVYYARLEKMLYEIARLYQRADREQQPKLGSAPRSADPPTR